MKAGRKSVLALGALLLAATPRPVSAQQTDYLTRDEVTEVRETQEPVKRVRLFLNYAELRLAVSKRFWKRPPAASRRAGTTCRTP